MFTRGVTEPAPRLVGTSRQARLRARAQVGAGALVCLALARLAGAEPAALAAGHERYRTPLLGGTAYYRGFASFALGDGLRFNNPYRLSTVLGDTPESVSRTAAYYDLGLGLVRGRDTGFAQGAVLHLSIAAQGIPQEVLSASYVAFLSLGNGRAQLFARAGIPIVLQPDVSAGLEASGGGVFMLTAGIGVQGELVGSLFYGAATPAHSVSTIPVLSGQLGVVVDYEVLP